MFLVQMAKIYGNYILMNAYTPLNILVIFENAWLYSSISKCVYCTGSCGQAAGRRREWDHLLPARSAIFPTAVIPASSRHSRESGNPVMVLIIALDSRFRGNDGRKREWRKGAGMAGGGGNDDGEN